MFDGENKKQKKKQQKTQKFQVQGPKFQSQPDPRGCGAFLFEKLEEHGEKICQVCSITEKTESFLSVKQRSTRVALKMKTLGIKPKDVVFLCSFNTLDVVVPLLATQYLGAITASLDPTLSIRDMVHLLKLCKPKMIFCCELSIPDLRVAVEKAKKETFEETNQEEFKPIMVAHGRGPNCLEFEEFQKPQPDEEIFKPIEVDNKETAFIIFSSGTTGLPKGLCLSHHGIIHASLSLLAMGIDYTSILHFSTFYWISALNLLFINLITGGQRVIAPIFDENTAFKIIQDFKVTYAFLASPYAFKLHRGNVSIYDTTSFKVCQFGGGPIGLEMPRLRKLLPHSKVTLCYGMTEISGFLSGYHTDNNFDPLIERPSSSGFPAPGVVMRIVDPSTGTQLEPNQTGEIRVKCDSFFTSYYNSDTTDAFDDEGWLKSGDIGYFDEFNFLYVIDRIKEMFKYQSWHIVPASVEAIVYQHPAVKEAVVLGVPDEVDGDHPMAIVVLWDNYPDVTPEDVRSFVDERVIDREKLRGGVKIVKSMVKTPSGKVLRRIMRGAHSVK